MASELIADNYGTFKAIKAKNGEQKDLRKQQILKSYDLQLTGIWQKKFMGGYFLELHVAILGRILITQ
jgi:hypothetical protein